MGSCCAEACTAAVLTGVMRLPGCPFGSAWSVRFVGWADWVDCRCFLSFVFLGVARRLELSPCNTPTRYHDGGLFRFIRSALLLAVIRCWVDRCFGSWVHPGTFLRIPGLQLQVVLPSPCGTRTRHQHLHCNTNIINRVRPSPLVGTCVHA